MGELSIDMLNLGVFKVLGYRILIYVNLWFVIDWNMIIAWNMTCVDAWNEFLDEYAAGTAICIIMQIAGLALSVSF